MEDAPKGPETQKPGSTEEEYNVGYGKPPKHTQFKKGQSGNRKGRPKGSGTASLSLKRQGKMLIDIVLMESQKTITVTEYGRNLTISQLQALIRSLMIKALKGSVYAIKTILFLIKEAEERRAADIDRVTENWVKYKRDWTIELNRREKLGIVGPEPVIHPDNVVFDIRTGELNIYGPLSLEEKSLLAAREVMLKNFKKVVKDLQDDLSEKTDPREVEDCKSEIEHFQTMVEIIECDIESTKRPETITEFLEEGIELFQQAEAAQTKI